MKKELIITHTHQSGGYHFGLTADSEIVFIPQVNVEGNRFLRPNDRVSCEVIDNSRKPGKLIGIHVKYLGHVLARQVSDSAVRP